MRGYEGKRWDELPFYWLEAYYYRYAFSPQVRSLDDRSDIQQYDGMQTHAAREPILCEHV